MERKLATANDDISVLLEELRESTSDQSTDRSVDHSSMDVDGNKCDIMLKNSHLEAELHNAARLCKYVEDGSKTYIGMMNVMLVDDGEITSEDVKHHLLLYPPRESSTFYSENRSCRI